MQARPDAAQKRNPEVAFGVQQRRAEPVAGRVVSRAIPSGFAVEDRLLQREFSRRGELVDVASGAAGTGALTGGGQAEPRDQHGRVDRHGEKQEILGLVGEPRRAAGIVRMVVDHRRPTVQQLLDHGTALGGRGGGHRGALGLDPGEGRRRVVDTAGGGNQRDGQGGHGGHGVHGVHGVHGEKKFHLHLR